MDNNWEKRATKEFEKIESVEERTLSKVAFLKGAIAYEQRALAELKNRIIDFENEKADFRKMAGLKYALEIITNLKAYKNDTPATANSNQSID